MFSRIIGVILLCIGVYLYFVYATDFEQPKRETAYPVVARPKEIEGDVRVRIARQPNWLKLGYNSLLHVGDVIYVGENSKLSMEYVSNGVAIVIPQNSLYPITRHPQPMSKLKRLFYASTPQKKGSNQTTRLFVRMERMPGRDYLDAENEAITAAETNDTFQFSRTARVLPVKEPRGDLTVSSSSYPLSLRVVLEAKAEGQVFAYLWKKGGSAVPLWTGVGTHPTFYVPIPTPGQYIFQAVSEDDSLVTPGLTVSATNATGESLLGQNLLTQWHGRQTLVLR